CIHNVSSKHGATVFALITGGVEPAREIGEAPPSRIFMLSEMPWMDSPILPGVKQKTVLEDKAEKRMVVLARFEPGTRVPRHRHVREELIYMIEGAHADEFCEISAGNFNFRAPGCEHEVVSKNGATGIAIMYGPIERV
ncbi:MAG: cupin domain-containing protein, partial [Candidatus Binataceae bacterium]